MKRFIFLILSVCLCLMFCLSGCSCAGNAVLEFNSTQVKSIRRETLKYSVTLEKNYKDIKRSSSLNENLLPLYENGEYEAVYETGVALPNGIENNINLSPSESVISVIRTTLNIDVVDTNRTDDAGDDKTYKDQIISEVYFYDSAWSYAPIYSKTIVKNTYLANDETNIEFAHKTYRYETIYKKSSYVMNKTHYQPDDGEDITNKDVSELIEDNFVPMVGNNKSYEYGFREVIDNVQLMFVTRNLDISKGGNITIPVVNYMYSKPTLLQIKNSSHSTLNIEKNLFITYTNPTFRGEYPENTLSMPVKNISITLSDTDYIGMPKYVVVQNGSADTEKIKNNGLIAEYAEAVTANASYNCFGALVYRLKDVNITYNS